MSDKNLVLSWASNVRGAEYGFIKAVIYALEQFQHKNNIPLSAMVALCNGKSFGTYKIVEGDRLAYATPLKRILGKALSDATLTFKDGKAKWKVGANGGVNADVLELLRRLATVPGISIRHESFKTAFPKDATKSKAKKDATKVAKDMFKVLADNGLALGDVMPHLQALVAQAMAAQQSSGVDATTGEATF